MKEKKMYFLISIFVSFLLLSAWKGHYSALSPSSFLPSLSLHKAEKKLHISARAYTAQESEQIFAHNLVERGFHLIEITVHNQTPESYGLSRSSVSLSCGTSKEVSWKIFKRGLPRSVGLQVASLFFWPFSIPSALNSIHGYKTNSMLKEELEAKTLKDEEEIVPAYSTVKRVMYVKDKEAITSFTLALEAQGSKELVVIPVPVS